MTDQPQKTAIVIGASGGIGRAVALRLARDGFAIVAHYSGNAAKVDETVSAIKAHDGKAIGVKADVAAEGDVVALFDAAQTAFGRIDVVVQSAGIMPMSKVVDGDFATFDRVIATNLRGTYIVLSQAARRIGAGGRIIVFSSSVVAKSFPGYGAYIASKCGVEGLMHVLANELRGRNVTVNAIAPGPTGTDLFLKDKSTAQIEEFARMAPLERIGQPEDIAGVVAFLAGPDGAWVNAQVIRANGGFA